MNTPPTESLSPSWGLQPGLLFHGRYEFRRCIKSGGMGAIHVVFDRVTRRERALKTMLPSIVSDPDLRARFSEEATVTAPIQSSHIVEVFDAGVDAPTGLPFIVMELLEGEDLGATLRRRGKLSFGDTLLLLKQAALALDKTHAARVVHRDLKPENLFVTTRDDGCPHLKVLDFGIAKVVAASTSAKTTRNVGTPLYMSPEQIRGEGTIGPKADLYSLGHIAYALLTGESYWELEAETVEGAIGLFLKVLQGLPEAPTVRAQRVGAVLPAAFDPWFARATALEPEQRFSSAMELVTALGGVLAPRVGLGGTLPVGVPLGTSPGSEREAPGSGVTASLPAHSRSVQGPGRTRMGPGAALLALVPLVALTGAGAWGIYWRGASPIPTLTQVALELAANGTRPGPVPAAQPSAPSVPLPWPSSSGAASPSASAAPLQVPARSPLAVREPKPNRPISLPAALPSALRRPASASPTAGSEDPTDIR